MADNSALLTGEGRHWGGERGGSGTGMVPDGITSASHAPDTQSGVR